MEYTVTMVYYVSCKKNTANKHFSVRRTKQDNRLMVVSNCAICCEKKSRFIKNRYFKY